MAGGESTTARNKRQALQLPGQGQSSASFLSTRPRKHVKKGQKQSPLRRSPRLRRLKEINDTLPAPSHAPLPSPSPVSDDEHARPFPTLPPSKLPNLKRENEQDEPPSQKRPRTSCPQPSAQHVDSIAYWAQTCYWPQTYLNEIDEMNHLLAKKRSSASLRRKRSDNESSVPSTAKPTTPSDQKPREEKSTAYQEGRYEVLLATKNSFMDEHEQDITDESKRLCKHLLDEQPAVPKGTMFSAEYFRETCKAIRAEAFAIRGNPHCRLLVESVNEGWNNSIPLTKPRPQPDYSVGFKRLAFTEDQLHKLSPFVGGLWDTSFFMGTFYMYFPFFSSEVKCGAEALNVADRQNAHSMTLAVRGVVELFRLVNRENELNREILAFSISHDHQSVRIYGHYSVIEGKKTTFFRHTIRSFDFTELDGKDKWTTYQFTKSVYDIWMPAHFRRLCSAIDALPADIRFDVSEDSELQYPSSSGMSPDLESHHLLRLGATNDDGQSSLGSRQVTPNTSVTQKSDQATSKKAKKK